MTGLINGMNLQLKVILVFLGIKDKKLAKISSVCDIHSNQKVEMMKLSAIVILVALGVAAAQSQDQCNVCQSSSNILCESESTYYLCVGK